jgi:protein-tyrosine phosphatase
MRLFAHALEDLPEEVRQQAADIAATKPGISFRRRVIDEIETIGLDSYGTLEQAPLLHFLSRYPVTAYTYQLSAAVSRGQRPDGARLADLAGGQRYQATINLCAEMDGGDAPAIAKAGLTGALRTRQVPITDMEPPTVAQVIEILDLLSGPDAEPTYVHCEAGRARTGVAIACYRMAVMGWSAADALTEAVNFGCIVPGQQAFISQFGDLLEKGTIAGRYYPLLPPGSVKPTATELAATIHSAAAAIQNAAAAIQSAAATIHSAAADAEQGAVS